MLAPDRPLLAAYRRVVEDRHHLRHLARTYLPAQPEKHGLSVHPALYEGNGFLDLVGARVLDQCSCRLLLGELPRFRMREVFPAPGLDPGPIEPLAVDRLVVLGPERLAEAARSVLGSDGAGRVPHAVATRRVAAALAFRTGMRPRDLARCFGTDERSVQRDARLPPVERQAKAVLVRLAIEERCRATRPEMQGAEEGA